MTRFYVWWWNAHRQMWCHHLCRSEDTAYSLAFGYVLLGIATQIRQGAPA